MRGAAAAREAAAQKTAACDRDDMEECTRLRDLQMLLLEQAQPGSKGEIGAVPSEALSGQLQKEVASVMGEVEELAALREELEADLAASRRAAAGRQASSASSGGSGGAACSGCAVSSIFTGASGGASCGASGCGRRCC